MTCQEARALIARMPDLLESDEMRAHLYDHTDTCIACAQLLNAQEALLEDLACLDSGLEVPEGAALAWRTAIRQAASPQPKTRASWNGWLTAIAATAVLALGVSALVRSDYLGSYGDPMATSAPQMEAYSEGASSRMIAPMADMGMLYADEAYEAESSAKSNGQVLLKSASLRLESTTYEADMDALDALLRQTGGWVESRSVWGTPLLENPQSGRTANLSMRVPVNELDAFLDAAGKLGTLTSSNLSVEDVTSHYTDVEGRLSTAIAQRDRLNELLVDAQSMSDILAIEDKLYSVQYTLESLTGTLNHLDSRANDAQVSLTISEISPKGIYAREPLWNRIVGAFADSWKAFGTFFQDALIWLVMVLPYAAVVLVLLAVVVLVIKIRKPHKQRRSLG